MGYSIEKEDLFEGFAYFSLILVILVSFGLTMSVDTDLLWVLVGFLPMVLTIVFSLVLYEGSKHNVLVTWIIPVILAAIFFLSFELSTNLDMGDHLSLVYVNLAGSFLYLSVAYLLILVFDEYK